MIIKLDIDGVLRDMVSEMVKLYNEKFGTSMTTDDVKDYDIDVSFPLLRENGINSFQYFFDTHSVETMLDAKAFPGAADAVKAIRAAGHTVKIVSFQPTTQAQIKTRKWLTDNGIEYDDLIFTDGHDKTGVYGHMIVDDCPKYLQAENEEVTKICIRRPYNVGEKEVANAYYADSLEEFAKQIAAKHYE